MSSNRGRDKQLAKQKKKRAAIKSKQAAHAASMAPSALVRRADEFPIERTLLSTSWKADDPEACHLIQAVLVRRAPGGYLLGSALVDRTCMGVKDAMVRFVEPPLLDAMLNDFSEVDEFEEVPAQVCLSVIHHAIDYAKSLGMSPHADFSPKMFPRPQALVDTPLATPDKPVLVVTGDDCAVALSKVVDSVGLDFVIMAASQDGELRRIDPRDVIPADQAKRLEEARVDTGESATDGGNGSRVGGAAEETD